MNILPARSSSVSTFMLALVLLPASAFCAEGVRALTERYCETCHNSQEWAGGLDLSTMDQSHLGQDADSWEKVVLKLRTGMMPPPGKDRPSRAETEATVRFLESKLDAETGMNAAAPVLHRLNRAEYANAIRDIFGLHVNVEAFLPPDDASNGFDNVASGLGISPALIQGYVTAAMKLSRAAVGDMTATPTTVAYETSPKLSQDEHLEGMPLGSRGGLRVAHNFPVDAEYRISVRNGFGGGGGFAGAGGFGGAGAAGDRGAGAGGRGTGAGGRGAGAGGFPAGAGAGGRGAGAGGRGAGAGGRGAGGIAGFAGGMGFGGTRVDLELDGQPIEQMGVQNGRIKVKAGQHVLTAAIFDQRRTTGVNDIYSVYKVGGGIEGIEITGPYNATGAGDTESRRRIFTCRPQSAAAERGCAEKIIVNIASRAFRAPQQLKDLDVAVQFYERGRAEGGFEVGIQQALSRILIDPRFLFRFEEDSDPADGSRHPVSDIELASRLSFFLWSSIPDQELIDLATRKTLHKPDVLVAQVKRMLADPKSRALVENFADQWLYLRELATVTPEVDGFDENLREAFIEETRSLVAWIIAQDRPLTELLTADYTFVNERLARHYGIPGVRGSHFRMVKLPAETHRRGVLGHGSILTVTSTATRTSPVIRGAWVLENILGAPPPAPPPGVETNIDGDGTQVLTSSVRERLELHRKNPSCAACHSVIDPIGFALENFNAIGAWRERDGDSAVDARGTLVDGTKVSSAGDLVQALMGNSRMFVTTFTEKLMTYALGRTVDYRDMPTVRSIVNNAAGHNYNMSELILGVVQSPAFNQRARAQESARVARAQGLP